MKRHRPVDDLRAMTDACGLWNVAGATSVDPVLSEAPASDYVLLTTIIVAAGVIPAGLVAARRSGKGNDTALATRRPRWLLWVSLIFLAAWWFAAAWLFLRD